MALIMCPECGQEISDKATKCIHCGKVFVEEDIIVEELTCAECGAVLSETDEICANCGCPVERKSENDEVKPQQVEVASIKMTKKTKQIIIGVISALIVCVIGGVGFKIYSSISAEQKYQETYNVYIDNLDKVKVLMLTGASDAEKLCNLTLRVWGNTIYEENDSATNKYTRKNNGYGSFYDDFNDALANLFADSSTKTTISDIEGNQVSVKEVMKELQNPPVEMDKCYDTISDLYEAYSTLTDLAVNPSGNYSGFSSNKNDAVSDFKTAYDKLDAQIPDKLESK